MSPEIKVNGQIVADVPDETGLHQALDGSPLWVDLSRIEARNNRQLVGLEGSAVGGQRVVGLTQEGKGLSSNLKKGGDGKEPVLEVALYDRPIRLSYRDYGVQRENRSLAIPGAKSMYEDKRTYYNPRWVRK